MWLLDFIATPFLLLGSASMWLASLINGKQYVLMEVEYHDDDEDV